MASQDRWFFSKEKLGNTPSKKDGVDIRKELFYRQQAATLVQDMGQKLMVSQLCINSAIVYMHRFYMFHSFTKFHRNLMAPCCLFLACKVEEQPRKLEHLLKVGWNCMNKEGLDVKSDKFRQLYDELVRNENILLATLGFDCSIDHPHTHVVKCCQLIKASRDLAQTSYFMATNSLHLTMMCLEYRSTLVACVCIYLVYKWSGHEIPKSSKGKDWFWYVDRDVTLEQLERVSEEFLLIFNQCPSKLKNKIMRSSRAISDQEAEQMKRQRTEASRPRQSALPPASAAPGGSGSAAALLAGLPPPPSASGSSASAAAPPSAASRSAATGVPEHGGSSRSAHQPPPHMPPAAASSSQRSDSHKLAARAYREKKEREHLKAEKKAHGGERDRRPAPRPPVKQEPGVSGGAGDAHKPRPDALHKPSSVSDVRDLLKDVDGRHSLLHSLEHPAQRGAEPGPRPPPHARPHPAHARPHPSAPPAAATADKPPHSRSGQESRHPPSSQRHRPDGESAHKAGHHRSRPASASAGSMPPAPGKAARAERPPPLSSSAAVKPEKRSPARTEQPNGVSLPTVLPPPPVKDLLSSSLALAQTIKDEFMPHAIMSPLMSPLFDTTSPDLSDVLPPPSEPEPLLTGIVPKMQSRLSPLCFTESSPPAPPPPPPPPPPAPVVLPTPPPPPSLSSFKVEPAPLSAVVPPAPRAPPTETKPRPKPLSPLKLPANGGGGGGGSIFSPPAARASRGTPSDPELVLPKVDDIPMFSPLKGGTTGSIRLPRGVGPLPGELRSNSISSHDSDFEAVVPPPPPPPPPPPALLPTSLPPAPVSAAQAAVPFRTEPALGVPPLAKMPSAPPSLINAPISASSLLGETSREERHKHKEKKKKKKEHKEHKEHKHKKEKKHKEHKEKKKDKHRDRPRDESKQLKITISKDKLSGAEVAPAAEAAGGAGVIPKLTIRRDGSPVSSPGNSLKIRIGKGLVTPAEGQKTKRRRESSESDPGGSLVASLHGSGSKHKHRHKRNRQDSDRSDALQF